MFVGIFCSCCQYSIKILYKSDIFSLRKTKKNLRTHDGNSFIHKNATSLFPFFNCSLAVKHHQQSIWGITLHYGVKVWLRCQRKERDVTGSSYVYKLPDVSLNLDHNTSNRKLWCPRATFDTPDHARACLHLTLTLNLSQPGTLDELSASRVSEVTCRALLPVRPSVVIEEASTALTADVSAGELQECQGLGAERLFFYAFVGPRPHCFILFSTCLSPCVCFTHYATLGMHTTTSL